MTQRPTRPVARALAAALPIAAALATASAQTASVTFDIPDFRISNAVPQFIYGIDTSAVDFSDPYLAFRVTADWRPLAPGNGVPPTSIDNIVGFGNPSSAQFISDIAFALGEGSTSRVNGLTFTGGFTPAFTGLPTTDFVAGAFFGFGSSIYTNVQVEWFTRNDLSLSTLRPGRRSAQAPTTFTDLGALASVGEDITFDTFGTDFDTEIAIYAADGTLIAQNDDANNARGSLLTLGTRLVFGTDGSINLEQFGPGEYFLALSDYDTQFFENFDLFLDPFTNGGPFTLNVNGASAAAGSFTPYEVQYFRFTIVPAPASATALLALGTLAVRRRRG